MQQHNKTRFYQLSVITLLTMVMIFGATATAIFAQSVTVTEGQASFEDELFGVRFRSFNNTGGQEVYVGIPDLGSGGNRSAINMNWAGSNNITFEFDRTNDQLVVTVLNSNDTYTVAYTDLANQVNSKTGFTLDDLEQMQINVTSRDSEATVDFLNVMINGTEFSDNDFNDNSGGTQSWTLSGVDFTQTFSVTGLLILGGTFGNSQELSKMEITFGKLTTTTPTTNTGSLTIVKQLVDNSDTLERDFVFSGTESFTLTTNTSSATHTVSSLAAGSYTITETPPAQWTLKSVTCLDGSSDVTSSAVNFTTGHLSATITLSDAQNLVCTFTNQRPTLYMPVIIKS